MAESERARIGDFQILGKIGEGSLGTVFRAECLADGPPPLARGMEVALKRLHPSADLLREMTALNALSHPHIVRFLGCFVARQGEWDEAAFLVTELLEGCDLAVHLETAPTGLPWAEAFRILDQALDALSFAETRGVVHRDVKPSNLFLCRDGCVKVIDFGLARRTGGTVSLTSEGKSRGGLTGTLDYMAPEFARVDGFRGDSCSDIFSFGVLACQVMTGLLPFPPLGEHPEIAFIRRWTGQQPPRAMVPRPVAYAWEGAAAFLARALNPDREARFRNFSEARAALGTIRPRVLRGEHDEYRVDAFLASGGFCDVFRARGVRTGLAVAIKRLHSGRHEWRFRREAGLLGELQALNHPALVKIIELIEESGPGAVPCLVMDYLPGDDLRRRLEAVWETGTGIPRHETAALFVRYLEGLEALHERGIAHRDIKPANLYAPDGKPEEGRLLDLGVACERDGTVSMQGMPPGTLDYMAPELASEAGSRGTPQSDIFALGCSLYEALTGKPAMKRLPREETAALKALCARSESEQAFAAALEGFEDPVFRECPDLAAIVACAMRFDPATRYGGGCDAGGWSGAGARAMRDDLAVFLETEARQATDQSGARLDPGEAPATSDNTVTVDQGIRPARSPRAWPVALAGMVLLAGGIWFGLKPKPAQEPDSPVVSTPSVPVEEAQLSDQPEAPAPSEPVVTEPEPEPAVAVSAPEPVVAVPEPVSAQPPVESKPEAPRIVIRPPPATVPKTPSAEQEKPIGPAVIPAVASQPETPVNPVEAGVDQKEIEAALELADSGLEEWRIWLSRLSDPLRSVTLKRFEAGRRTPPWRGELPVLLAAEREALPDRLRWRVERALLWEQAAPALKTPAEFIALAKDLNELAERAKAADPGTAGECLLDSRLLEWNGQLPPDPKEVGSSVGLAWRAHALAAAGDDQDSREVLGLVADYASQPDSTVRPEDGLLAVRTADACLARAVAEVRDATSPDVVAPGTGLAVRDPVGAYSQAVMRVRGLAIEDAGKLMKVAQAMKPAESAALTASLEAACTKAGAGDWAMALAQLEQTPWRTARAAWTDRVNRMPAEDRMIFDHVLGLAPLPVKVETIPVARLRK